MTSRDGRGDAQRYIARALQLAEHGRATAHPNPRVGCVVVADGAVVGEGWHKAAGGDHAEIIALAQAGDRARGATLYVTLEPCAHHGRTPPCCDAIIAAGVARAVIAMQDPNPRVNGAGIAALRAAGIAVQLGPGAAAAQALNRGFCKRMRANLPWVTLKIAASLDGKTALADGASQWITSPAARQDAHQLRAESSAIMTGVGTIARDDPQLTARPDGQDADKLRQPLRVIMDSQLRIARAAKVLQPPGEALIFTACARADNFHNAKRVQTMVCQAADGRVDLLQAMRELAAREINEVLVEGGARLHAALLRENLVDEIIIYFAPKLLGDGARGMFAAPIMQSLNADMHTGARFKLGEVRRIAGDDDNLRVTLQCNSARADTDTDTDVKADAN